MIKYTIKYMQEIIGWAPSFSIWEIITQNNYLFCFILVLKVSLRLTPIPKGWFRSFQVTPLPLMTEFSKFMPLQGNSTREQLARERFFKDYKIIWKTKMRELTTKEYLENLILLLIKSICMVEIKKNTLSMLFQLCSNCG